MKKAEKQGNEFVIYSDRGKLPCNHDFAEMIFKVVIIKGFYADMNIIIDDLGDDKVLGDCISIIKIYGNGEKPMAVLIPETFPDLEKRKNEVRVKFGIECVELLKDFKKMLPTVLKYKK